MKDHQENNNIETNSVISESGYSAKIYEGTAMEGNFYDSSVFKYSIAELNKDHDLVIDDFELLPIIETENFVDF